MRSRFRSRKRKRSEAVAEIELMPMLNVFISIIPLLLLSAAFIKLSIIPTALPSNVAAAPASNETPLDLTLFIRSEAYLLRGNGVSARSIPRSHSGTGAQDPSRGALAAALSEISAAHPGDHEVRIVADATTRYEEIIDAMDVARGAGFHEAALADAGGGTL